MDTSIWRCGELPIQHPHPHLLYLNLLWEHDTADIGCSKFYGEDASTTTRLRLCRPISRDKIIEAGNDGLKNLYVLVIKHDGYLIFISLKLKFHWPQNTISLLAAQGAPPTIITRKSQSKDLMMWMKSLSDYYMYWFWICIY